MLGAGAIECYYKNSICVGQVPGTLANINLTCHFIHHTWANIQHVSALSRCMPVSVGPPMSTTCLNCNVMIEQ